jgi:hypothetical protein
MIAATCSTVVVEALQRLGGSPLYVLIQPPRQPARRRSFVTSTSVQLIRPELSRRQLDRFPKQ